MAMLIPVTNQKTKSIRSACFDAGVGSQGTKKATADATAADRKSTRLNSSHSQISYAVFCLKKNTASHTQRGAADSGYVSASVTSATSPQPRLHRRPTAIATTRTTNRSRGVHFFTLVHERYS